MLATSLRCLAMASSAPTVARLPAIWRSSWRPVCNEAASPSPVASALANIRAKVKEASQAAGSQTEPRLVAVSKTKSVELLREAYDAGIRDFGENYVQEVVSKAPDMPSDVAWRFIGNLQSNKAKTLVQGVPSLACVETVSSKKLANKLDAAVATLNPPRHQPLDVMLQVDTSPWEGTKSGLPVDEASAVALHVRDTCPNLRLVGLMTIGAPGETSCFDTLADCRRTVAESLGLESEDALELSMGMSGDFEAAIGKGSTSVRVGSSIFGARG